jgi:copper(I)-binding protein
VTAAGSARAAAAELHQTTFENDRVSMRPVEAVSVPAGAQVEFRPHGLHVMLHDIVDPLLEGERFPLWLEFECDGGADPQRVTLDVAVGAMSAMAYPEP